MTELATIDSHEMNPMAMLEGGQQAANALVQVIDRAKDIVVMINGNKYIKVEGWIFIGKAHDTHAATEWTRSLTDENGEVIAYEAKVNLMKDGVVVGSAISECGMDESVARGRKDRSGHNAAKSMAQTRATSKAFRMSFSWVAVLAGYKPTPAEEMDSVPQGQTRASTNPGLMCPEHGEEWFKKGRMKNYAHKIGETDKWCNMPKREVATETPLKGATATIEGQAMTSKGFVAAYEQLGLDAKTVSNILGNVQEIQARLDAGDTWEDLLAAVKNAIQPDEPPEQEEMPF